MFIYFWLKNRLSPPSRSRDVFEAFNLRPLICFCGKSTLLYRLLWHSLPLKCCAYCPADEQSVVKDCVRFSMVPLMQHGQEFIALHGLFLFVLLRIFLHGCSFCFVFQKWTFYSVNLCFLFCSSNVMFINYFSCSQQYKPTVIIQCLTKSSHTSLTFSYFNIYI